MRKILLFLAVLLFHYPIAGAPPAPVDSVLFAYYTRCSDIVHRKEVLATADTLFDLSAEKGDARMQAAALSFKADHYYFNNNLDSLKAWVPRIYSFAKANDQIRYYFFAWNRVITLYTKASQYTYAQYELEKMLREAEQEQYKDGTAQAYTQMGHIFSVKGLDSLAANYYAKAIDYIETNDLSSFGLSTAYLQLSHSLINTKEYDKAREALENAEKHIAIPDQLWNIKRTKASLHAYMGEEAKALALLRDIELNGLAKISPQEFYGLQYSVYKALGMPDKATKALDKQIETYKSLGYSESFYTSALLQRAANLAENQNYQQAYEELSHYVDLYRTRMRNEGNKTFNEFATLFNLNRLETEKADLEKVAEAERHSRWHQLLLGQSILLLLTGVFVFLLVRLNRRLKRAKHEAESASRMKSLFIQHITHELNTPLNAIIGFAELAAIETDDDARDDYINIIHTNCGHLQKLVENAIYISDIESSDEQPHLTATDVNECCRWSLARITQSVKAGVNLRFTPGCDALTVCTNRVYVQQILINLLHNAACFTEQGRIELSYSYAPKPGGGNFDLHGHRYRLRNPGGRCRAHFWAFC